MLERDKKREAFPAPESSELDFDKLTDRNGVNVLGANVINATTDKFLGTVYMNREAYEKTLELVEVVAWSRDRAEIWHKGETSGNIMKVNPKRGIIKDCDCDTVNVFVDPAGPFCHTGAESCFDIPE